MVFDKKGSVKLEDRKIFSTRDYDQFNTMSGNRNVTRTHVRELQRLIMANGNLTAEFPIVVTEDMEVIDGQHRLEALRELAMEVAYVVQKGATINTVRAINLGNKNWGWRDLAMSYAKLGNLEYKWFLEYVDRYELSYTLACKFAEIISTRGNNRGEAHKGHGDFTSGYMTIEDKQAAVSMAEFFAEARKLVEADTSFRDFGAALQVLRRSPAFNDKRMLEKLEQKGHTLPRRGTRQDFMRAIEALYNDGLPEERKARLF